MRQVLFNQADTVSVYLLSLSTGDPISGIVSGDITLYYRKDGGASTQKTIDGTNFTEVDAANMPGLYEIDFTAAEFDTRGEFAFVIAENGGADLAQYNAVLQVGTPSDDQTSLTTIQDTLSEGLAQNKGGYNIPQDSIQSVTLSVTNNGQPVVGLGSDNLDVVLYKNGDPNPINNVADSLLTVGANFPGLYTITLGASDTDTLGDLFIDVNPQGLSITETSQTPPAGTFDRGNSVYAKSADEAFIATKNGALQGDLPIQTANGGDTWTTNGTILVEEWYAVDGVPGTDFVAVAGVVSGQPYLAYSDDFGTTWNYAAENSFTVFEPCLDVSVIDDQNAVLVTNGYVLYWDRVADPTNLSIIYTPGTAGGGSEDFEAVAAVDATTYVAVGNEGGADLVVRTSNSGGAWAAIAAPLIGNIPLYDVDFVPGSNVGWIVGAGGIILTTDDGGATLTTQGADTSEVLWSVWAVSETVAFTGGESVALYTSDGGDTWIEPGGLNSILQASTSTTYGFEGVEGEGWLTGIQGGSPFIINIEYDEFAADAFSLRYFVEEPAAVDLTPVTDALTDIQGAGFDTNTDSLVNIRTNVDAINLDLTPVTDSLDEIKGVGFTTGDNSLVQLTSDIAAIDVDLTPVLSAISNLESDVASVASDVTDLSDSVARLLGLSQENYRIVNQVYDANNKLTSASIRIFGSKADANGNTNPIAVYAVTATYNGQGLLVDYLVTKEA